ncbi:Rieske domain-containing protein-like [Octopus sinensis]|uniref:Rieske domain-containing protein-like n=1 Tax=Octopus sinensis TaxID=2607531 RepID=A0A6P7SMA0_9MOLL|nr:Rieske domain-containing protein-like [Octopus sinensis]
MEKYDVSNKSLFFPIEGITEKDLSDWNQSLHKCKLKFATIKNTSSDTKGALVNCNEKSVALFKHKDTIYAIDDKCPHSGGPLHMGDIEEMPNGTLCVRCPWHSWRFNLLDGSVVWPNTREDKKTNVYHTKVDSNGTISIAFTNFDEKYFKAENDF